MKPGQTLWSIAHAYHVDVSMLAHVNSLSDTSVLDVGRKLYIPGATAQHNVVSRCPCKVETSTFPPPHRSLIAEPSGVPPVSSEGSGGMQTTSMALIWPVHGRISRGLEQDKTRRHDGIDIAAPKGTPIQAAAAGEVVFSGWGPEGYGQMIILRHRPDLFTIYAHNDQNLVQRGEYVRQGGRIATVGQTGRATGSHLHFEIRHKTMPVIPERWLPQRSQNIVSLDRE